MSSSEDKVKSAKSREKGLSPDPSSHTSPASSTTDDSVIGQKKGSEKKLTKDTPTAPQQRRTYTVNVLSTELFKRPGEKAFTVRTPL
jgi:hypothetical protein